MRNNFLSKLTQISNNLDKIGEFQLAGRIDNLLLLCANNRTGAVDDFIQKLKEMFILVANNPNVPSINKDNLEIIFSVIDTLAAKGTFLNPSIKQETLSKITDEVNIVVDNLAELNSSISEIKRKLSLNLDDEHKQQLQYELLYDQKKFDEYMNKVNTWKAGNRDSDIEKYIKFKELSRQHKGK